MQIPRFLWMSNVGQANAFNTSLIGGALMKDSSWKMATCDASHASLEVGHSDPVSEVAMID